MKPEARWMLETSAMESRLTRRPATRFSPSTSARGLVERFGGAAFV